MVKFCGAYKYKRQRDFQSYILRTYLACRWRILVWSALFPCTVPTGIARYNLIPMIQVCSHALHKNIDAQRPSYSLTPFLLLEFSLLLKLEDSG